MIDLTRFTHLSFDCYGTLIDWESGILDALRPIFEHHGRPFDEADVLRLYAEFEAAEEAGSYRRYREILRSVVERFGRTYGFAPSADELDALAASIGGWPPFADSAAALRRLAARYRVVAVSNIDDDLLACSAAALGDPFDATVTAEQVHSYKPAPAHFEELLRRTGVPKERILHVAQSLFHDHAPARRMGFSTVRIDRRSRLPGTGIALPAAATPDLVLGSLSALVDRANL